MSSRNVRSSDMLSRQDTCATRLETSYFSFGLFDWCLAVDTETRRHVYLVRQTNFDHLCRLTYRMTFGDGEQKMKTDFFEHVIDTSGHGQPTDIGCDLYTLTDSKGQLRVHIDLMAVVPMSEALLCPFQPNKCRAHLYDREKQAWYLESDVTGEYLRLRLYYVDVRNIPRKCLRQVTWGLSIKPTRSSMAPVKAIGGPFTRYFCQADIEEGFIMNTDIKIDEVQNYMYTFLNIPIHLHIF